MDVNNKITIFTQFLNKIFCIILAPSAPPQSISAVPFPDSRIQVTWQVNFQCNLEKHLFFVLSFSFRETLIFLCFDFSYLSTLCAFHIFCILLCACLCLCMFIYLLMNIFFTKLCILDNFLS